MMLLPPPAPRCRPTLLPLSKTNPRSSTKLWAASAEEEKREDSNNTTSSESEGLGPGIDAPLSSLTSATATRNKSTTEESLELLQEIVRLQRELMTKDVDHKAIVDAKDQEIRRSASLLAEKTKENERLRAALKTAKRHSPQASGLQEIMKTMAKTRVSINSAKNVTASGGQSNSSTTTNAQK